MKGTNPNKLNPIRTDSIRPKNMNIQNYYLMCSIFYILPYGLVEMSISSNIYYYVTTF